MALAVARLELLNLTIEIENRKNLRRERVLRDKSKAFELCEASFRQLFRLERDLVLELCVELDKPLTGKKKTRTNLPVDSKILIALRFYAVGSYQLCVGQDLFLRVSQPTVSRASVSKAIVEKLGNTYIEFPTTEARRVAIKRRFMEKTRFPGVIGAIDCTHVVLATPPKVDGQNREYLFVNRKNYHSINVQLICDYDLIILHANAKFPGSTHDTYIYKNSNISDYLERLYREGDLKGSWLLGQGTYEREYAASMAYKMAATVKSEEPCFFALSSFFGGDII